MESVAEVHPHPRPQTSHAPDGPAVLAALSGKRKIAPAGSGWFRYAAQLALSATPKPTAARLRRQRFAPLLLHLAEDDFLVISPSFSQVKGISKNGQDKIMKRSRGSENLEESVLTLVIRFLQHNKKKKITFLIIS